MDTRYRNRLKVILTWIASYIMMLPYEAFRHVLSLHVNKTYEELRERCILEKKNTASSFRGSEENVIKFIRTCLLMHKGEIAEWLADRTDHEDWLIIERMDESVSGICCF